MYNMLSKNSDELRQPSQEVKYLIPIPRVIHQKFKSGRIAREDIFNMDKVRHVLSPRELSKYVSVVSDEMLVKHGLSTTASFFNHTDCFEELNHVIPMNRDDLASNISKPPSDGDLPTEHYAGNISLVSTMQITPSIIGWYIDDGCKDNLRELLMGKENLAAKVSKRIGFSETVAINYGQLFFNLTRKRIH